MDIKKRQVFMVAFSGLLILSGSFIFINFNVAEKLSDNLKIWNASLKYPVLGDVVGGSCGNNIAEEGSGEECDDGNSLSEDGCSPSCQWENVSIAYSWCGTTSCPVGRIYSQDGSAYNKQFWHIVPAAYIEIADIGNTAEVARIKTITDGQPRGFRAVLNYFYPRWGDYIDTVGDKDNIIIPGSCTNPNDLSTCERVQDVPVPPGCTSPYITIDGYAINYRSPWWNNWVSENQSRLRTFLNDYIALGGKPIDYFQSDYEMGFDVGFARPWDASFIPSGDNSDTPCNESLYYPAFNERVEDWWNGIQNDPRFPAMASRLAQYGFVIPPGKTLYEYITPWTYEWTRPATTNIQLMWNSVAWDMEAEYLNQAYYNVLKSYYPNAQMTDNANFMHSSAYPIPGLLWPYGSGVKVGTHQDTATYENITFSSFKLGINGARASALAAPSVPLRVWLSHWSYNLSSPQNQTFNLNYAKYWTENVFHVLLTGSDGISWFNSSGNGENQDTRTTADRTAESAAMNTLLQEFDQLTYFRQDRQSLATSLVSDSANYVLTSMRVPNHYNLYRFTPNQDSGQTYQVLQEDPAIFLVNNTTRILIPNGEIYTPANNVAPYGYWIIQPLGSASPIIETGSCVNTCIEPPPECTNECILGQSTCSDTSHRQICGQYDTDECLEWSAAQICSGSTACGYETCPDDKRPVWRCENGGCLYLCNNDTSCSGEPPPPECTNECILGQSACSDTSHRQICGQYDTDGCLEWSAASTCQGNVACDYGNCSAIQRPSWSCKGGKCIYTCSNSQSCQGTKIYIKNYKKECYNNNVYWYDSTGQIQDIYDECQNSYCDNVVCVDYNPAEYCQGNSHCKDNTCNCDEDALTCPEDCASSALVLTLYARDRETGEWKQKMDLTQSQTIEFLLVVSNNSPESIDEVTASVELPSGVAYQQDLKIDDTSSSENITYGMDIGSLEPFSEKKITFTAKVSQRADAAETITAKVKSNDLAGADSITIGIAKSEEKQSLFDLLVQFVSSHVLITVILVAAAYLTFAVAGYMLFKRFAG